MAGDGMVSDYATIEPAPAYSSTPARRRGGLGWLILLLLGFAGGAVATGYILLHWPLARQTLFGDAMATRVAQTAPVIVAAPAPSTMPVDTAATAALDARVAGLEGRIGQIAARANAAVGNADRAEGLLVAFAARRALDRGVALGYIEALLRERFGERQPQAVATIIAAARQPVTLEELQAGLADAGEKLTGGGPNESWLDGVRRELASLVIVRRANVPSPDPADRLARARRQVEAGHVTAALAEVARMPGRDSAAGWIAAARRYAAARDALDVIETAALLEPRASRPAIEATPAPSAPVADPAPTADPAA